MTKKGLAVLLALIVSLSLTGCGKKDNTANQSIAQLVQGYQQSMVTYFDIKNMQDNSVLITQINDNMRKVEESKKKLEQISGLAETVTDEKLRAELLNFIDLGREREKLILKYLNDIRRDLDYKLKNPGAQVNINAYITNIPNHLLDFEYRSKQSLQRLEKMLAKK
ncbi:MAG: hypothetical protein K6T66_05840 [Peptococcaceae bacterium]|nr:hypothetical protein [Peptococcaceae bacterium]